MPDDAEAGYGDAVVVTRTSVATSMNDKGNGSFSMT